MDEALPQAMVAPLERLARQLEAWARAHPNPTLADLEQGYFTTNADRMCYPEFRAQGLPIGSGAVESAAGHEVQRRMKRPGARWSKPGAQAILTLRTHLDSGRPLPLPTKQVA